MNSMRWICGTSRTPAFPLATLYARPAQHEPHRRTRARPRCSPSAESTSTAGIRCHGAREPRTVHADAPPRTRAPAPHPRHRARTVRRSVRPAEPNCPCGCRTSPEVARPASLGWAVMNEHSRWQGLATKAIHAGFRPDPATGAVNAPIYASSTFAQDGVGGLRGGFEYARTGNPTRAALEASLAAVEEAAFGRAFSSGMAATDCALRAVLRPGDHVVIPDDAYGGTFRLIDKVFTQWGVDYTPWRCPTSTRCARRSRRNTRLIWVETPTNPLLSIADIAAIAEIAAAVGREGVGGQHLRLAGAAAAADARRRHRAALDDEVHRRALRRRRWRAGDQRRGTRRRHSDSCRTARVRCPARSTPI